MNHPLNLGRSKRELLGFSLPTIFTMLVLASYVVVDGIFVSRYVGSLALSSLNMVYPAFGALQAIALMLAVGGSAYVAKLMGEGQAQKARASFSMLVCIQLGLGLTLGLAGILGVETMLDLVGCSEAQRDLSRAYIIPLLIFAPAQMIQMSFQMFFVTAGRPALGLGLVFAAGICNVCLDYLFIVEWNWGISGAAYATSLGACIPAVVGLLYFFFNDKSVLQLTRPKLSLRQFGRVCYNGSSEMMTSLSMAVSTYLFNLGFMKYYGETGVAALSIVLYLQFLFVSITLGFSDGIAPIISYQYGRDDKAMLKRIRRSALLCVGCISVFTYVVALLCLDDILAIFAMEGSDVYRLAQEGFYSFSLGYLLMGFAIFISAFFTALGNGLFSALVAVARTLIFLGSGIILLPLIWGSEGLWLAIPVAESLGLIFAFYCLSLKKKKYGY